MFIITLGVLLTVSFLLALRSLRKELNSPKEIEPVKRELIKEKAHYIRDKD